MALEKQTVVDLIETLKNGMVQVRTKTVILENGKEISSKFHRHVVVPGADYSAEDAKVQAICAAVHTPDVITEYEAAVEAAIQTLDVAKLNASQPAALEE